MKRRNRFLSLLLAFTTIFMGALSFTSCDALKDQMIIIMGEDQLDGILDKLLGKESSEESGKGNSSVNEPEEDLPNDTMYELNDVMEDFSLTTSEGDTFMLSEVLEEKKLVMLNFWATWCGPCKEEFPPMQEAYMAYQDEVAILAISITDSMTAVSEYKALNGLTFDMTSGLECGLNFRSMFNTASIPVTVVIDRSRTIVHYHVGNMIKVSDFTNLFERHLGEEY